MKEVRGRGGYVETKCDRGVHDYRLFDYHPATVICLDCGIRQRLSELGPRKIIRVKKLEAGIIKDFEALDYEDGPNGYPVIKKVGV